MKSKILSYSLIAGISLLCSSFSLAQTSSGGRYKDCEITYATEDFVSNMDQEIVKAFSSKDISKISDLVEYPVRIRDGHRTFYLKTEEAFRRFIPTLLSNTWLKDFNAGSNFRCRGNEYQYGNGLLGILGASESKDKPFKIVVFTVASATPSAPPSVSTGAHKE